MVELKLDFNLPYPQFSLEWNLEKFGCEVSRMLGDRDKKVRFKGLTPGGMMMFEVPGKVDAQLIYGLGGLFASWGTWAIADFDFINNFIVEQIGLFTEGKWS